MSTPLVAAGANAEAVQIYCSYLGVGARPDPYKVTIGALVLRCTIPKYVERPRSRGFEALLFEAVGAFPDGKNMVEKAGALARRAQLGLADGKLHPVLVECLATIQQKDISGLSQVEFAQACAGVHGAVEAVRVTLPSPVSPKSVQAIENVLNADFSASARPQTTARRWGGEGTFASPLHLETEDESTSFAPAPDCPNPGSSAATSRDNAEAGHPLASEAESTSASETDSSASETDSDLDSDQEGDVASDADMEMDGNNSCESPFTALCRQLALPEGECPELCRRLSVEEAGRIWREVEDDTEGYLDSDSVEEELGFAYVWRAQACYNAWQLLGPLKRKTTQPDVQWSANDHQAASGKLKEIGFNAVIFSEDGHTVAASFGDLCCSLAEASSARCFRFLNEWKGDATSRLPKPTGKRGFDKELADEVSQGLAPL